MRKILAALAALFVLSTPAFAQSAIPVVVTSCGSAQHTNVGFAAAFTVDTNGNLCTSGSGGGGGGAVTVADGADVTQGALADAACSTDNGTCSVEAVLKRIAQRLTTLIGGGSNSITSWGGGVLGAMANYGTSPGAVLVPGVNSFITGSAAYGTANAALPTSLALIGISDGSTSCSGGPCLVPPTGLATGAFGSPATSVVSVQGNDPCTYAAKSSAVISVTSATTTSLVAVSGSTVVYVCGYSFTIAPSATSADTAVLEHGTGASCTSPVALTGTYGNGDLTTAAPVTPIVYGGGGYTVGKSAAASGVCILTAGTTVNVQGIITYVQQ